MTNIDWQAFFYIAPFSWQAIGTAVLCGSLVGLERQMRGKPVGIRTSSLITLGTYLFVVGASSVMTEATDPSRIIGQVITGIGFLGAGVMLARDGIVVGVTSAATIWVLASIGVGIGLGHLEVAIKLSFVVVGVLFGVDLLEDYFQSLTRGVHRKYKGWKQSIRRDKQG
ncbi:MgtC/SapB family protein [Pseudidiomarina salilacus]|uniref:MgtC/SapB family protein n=1 Tax=Pseudidiomarina salilacus TaxID=3384452 RepID=UPI00398523C1